MVFLIALVTALSASAETVSGTCGAEGNNITWSLDTETGELTISGMGAMGDYSGKNPSPWGSYRSSIISATIKDGVTNIGPGVFRYCNNLKSVKIPSSVTSIDHEAFYECSSLESVEISEGVTRIDDKAFYECSSLASIEIPSGVENIGSSAFRNCSSLTSIAIPSSVTSIWGYVFSGCSSLASITVAEENAVFHSEGNCLIATESKTLVAGCKNSKIPDDGSVTSISGDAFYDCSSLESINIPSSVTSIETNAFFGCNNLAFITVAEGNTIYHSEGNCLIATESKTLVIGCKNSVIPADGSVTNIGRYAFSGCSGLTSLKIPSGVTSIGDYAFYGCNSLTSIEIPSGVTSIGNSAFSGCSSLTSIEIPSGVTSIGNSAFSGCRSLTSIEIPFGVTSIGSWAFYACSSLTSIEIPSSVASIGDYAFEDCNSLANIEIPSEVMSIGDYAFACCGNLTSVVFAEESKCESIGMGAFYECSSLTSIEIPSSVASIGDYAFEDCNSLANIEIPSSVTSIGAGAFSGCSGLTGITFLSSTTEIDDYEETIPTGTTIHGYAGSTAEAYATTYGRTFVPFATDTATVFELDMTFTPDTTQVGVYTPVASLNRVGADSSETLDFLYVEGSTGALAIKEADGVYQPLYDALGEAIAVGADETSVAVVYDNVNGLARYYINGSIPYYGESMALANDVSVCNAEFCKLEAVADTLTALDSVSVSHVYNINQSGTADFIGIQQKEGDTTTVRILSGVDMLYYGSIGFEVELFCDG